MTNRTLPETERTVSASLLRLCQRSPFFATLALHTRARNTDALPTAATDGEWVGLTERPGAEHRRAANGGDRWARQPRQSWVLQRAP
jgi:hypothetical protein